MKTSNKIVLAAAIVPFIIIVIMLFSLKNILNEDLTTKNEDINRGDYVNKNIDLKDFNRIKADGIWVIDLIGGDHFTIEINASEKLKDKISIKKYGNTLLLSSEKNHFSLNNMPKATITMPSISGLDLMGQFDINFNGFEIDELDVDLNGVANILGRTSGSIKTLLFNGNGVATVDLMIMPVTNAHFNFNGIYTMMIKMNSGDLTGILNGIGKLMTKGDVKTNTIIVNNKNHINIHD